MSLGYEIRTATAEDLDAILALEEASFPDPWSSTSWAEELAQDHGLVLVAVKPSGLFLGYVAYRHLPDEAELLRIAVEPEWRRLQVGSALVAAGTERLRQAGAATCHLEVREDNEPALAFYRRHGFVESGRRRRYYSGGVDAVLMRGG